MSLILLIRVIVERKEEDSQHLLQYGFIFSDEQDGISNKEFFNYNVSDTDIGWLDVCQDRDFGPNRTIIALAPAGNTIVNAVKTSLEKTVRPLGMTPQIYNSREEIMIIVGSSKYERDGVPGI